MSELDFGQKLEMRRAFWAMGASTRIDVKLSTLVKRDVRNRAGMEEWTDLDVLGVEYVPLVGLVFAVADCKTSKLRATERVFWLRGVADLFGARSAYLSRAADIPSAARQLALRLGVAAMNSSDRAQFLEQTGTMRLPQDTGFLEAETVRRWEALISSAPTAAEKLQRYRRSYYWVFHQRRNLLQLPGYLGESAKSFDIKQRWAQALLIDLAWLYLVTILWAVDELTRLQLSELSNSLQQVIAGGEHEIREKNQLLNALGGLIGTKDLQDAGFSVLPAWFSDLVDLASRVARRRSHATEALRILEFTGVESIANQGAGWTQAFPNSDPLDAKLASDVIRFLARAVGLPTAFVDAFDRAVAGQPSKTILSPGERSELGAQPNSQESLFQAKSDVQDFKTVAQSPLIKAGLKVESETEKPGAAQSSEERPARSPSQSTKEPPT